MDDVRIMGSTSAAKDPGDNTPSMTTDFLFHRAPAARRDDLASFWATHFGASGRVNQVYRWREADVANSGGNDPWIAERSGRIVGAMNTTSLSVGWGGHRIPAAWHLDSVVDPALRRLGVGSRLMAEAASDRTLVMAKGSIEAMYTARKKYGFVDVEGSNLLVLPLSIRGAGGKARRTRRAIAMVLSYARRRATIGHDVGIGEIHTFGDEFDGLAERVLATETLAPVKTSGYLRWRYSTCPGRKYIVLRASRERLLGGVVIRANRTPGADAWLVDLLSDPSETVASDALIRAAIRRVRTDGAGLLWVFATSPAVRARLARFGFLATRRTPHFTYHVRGPLPFDPHRVAWSFYHGDGDVELYWE